MERVRILLMQLPATIRGFTVYSFDEGEMYYTIIINTALNTIMQTQTYIHEVDHIKNNDFDKVISVQELESIRHFS